jgi:5-methyltetrahydrofolate--homocysteine methyltransferase
MSGLLVKSTVIMRDNLLELNERGLDRFPVVLGGAALTRRYVEEDLADIYNGNVYYAKDAFEGLALMEQISSGTAPCTKLTEIPNETRTRSHRVDPLDPELTVFKGQKSDVIPVEVPPKLPFYGNKKNTKFDIFELYKYINPIALFRGQWQLKRPEGMGNPEYNAWVEEQARPVFDRLCRELGGLMQPSVKWGYYLCNSHENDLIIYHEDGKSERERFRFPRQREAPFNCISDFFKPVGSGPDTVGFSIVTIGEEVTKHERKLFDQGEYQEYLYTHGMGVETAEALAEYWHLQMRREMGIDDNEPEELRLVFSAKYHGARYSFGYPACPNLEDQAQLFRLLNPEEIGIELTEEFMLAPEQSTSAIVVHHPAAQYFNIR